MQVENIRDQMSGLISNRDAARETIVAIQKATDKLYCLPKSKDFVKEERWKKKGIRKILVKNYSVYYWVPETEMIVYIIAVTEISAQNNTGNVDLPSYS